MKSIRVSTMVGAVLGSLVATQVSNAQFVNMFGDLGSQSLTGILVSPINSNLTTPFTWSAGAGSISGDVIMDNNATGTVFSLTITNLVYTCTVPNTAGIGDVTLDVMHHFQPGGTGGLPGPYSASHALAGSWTSGPASMVTLSTILDFGGTNVPLTPLFATVSPFSLGPVSATSSNSFPTYQIFTQLRLQTDNTGTITLPNSAHITVSFVPSPNAAGLLGLGGLLSVRRRRA